MTKAFQTAAAALLISMSATAAFAQVFVDPANAQQPAISKTIVITQLVAIENGYIVHHVGNSGQALNLIGAMTFGDTKLQKLIDAADKKTPIKIVVRGHQIVDIL